MNHLYFETTPISKLNYYSNKWKINLFCKRDDLFAKAGGGSKARMLQYILNDINKFNCDVLVTAGGPNSNFNRACALMCAHLGIKMHLIEYTDEPEQFNTSLNYYICQLAGISTTRCEKKNVPETIETVLREYRKNNIRTKFIYGGGKSLQGFMAYYEAVEELYQQGIRSIDHVFLACGTGTTLTGICAGFQDYFPKTKIHAISVARKYEDQYPVLLDNINTLNDYLNKRYTFDNLTFYETYLCGGYSHSCPQLLETIKECISCEGLIIDPVYTGKAFYGMSSIIEKSEIHNNQDVLFWNTGGLFNLLSYR